MSILEQETTKLVDACWSRIGVQGDRSCPELPKHIHCRNCPTHNAAARVLMDRPVPADYRDNWASYFAAPVEAAETDHRTCLAFRVQGEYLALPAHVVQEVTEYRPVRSLPHRRNDAVLGLINLRGELVILLSPARVLGIPQSSAPATGHVHFPRFLVIGTAERRMALTVDQIYGFWRYTGTDLREMPGTVTHAPSAQCMGMIQASEHLLGLLDPERLLPLLDRVVS
jgi:chemotaxis-related protein WspD